MRVHVLYAQHYVCGCVRVHRAQRRVRRASVSRVRGRVCASSVPPRGVRVEHRALCVCCACVSVLFVWCACVRVCVVGARSQYPKASWEAHLPPAAWHACMLQVHMG
jgi:hypothetical protein